MKNLLATTKFQIGVNFFRENSPERKQGFTLIELLIVITIIVILISFGAVAYSTAQRASRDAQRKSDLEKIQLALQEFHSDRRAYPDERWISDDDLDSFSCDTTGTLDPSFPPLNTPEAFACGSNTYLNKLPADPKTGVIYFYEINDFPSMSLGNPTWCDHPDGSGPPANCQKYTLWTRLENTNDPGVQATLNDQQCQVAWDIELGLRVNKYNYCVHQ